MGILATLLYIIFVLSAIVLIVVILLQEGKGGGFGQALGDHGQQTFGVGAKGINTFTGWTAVVFLGSALFLHGMSRSARTESKLDLVDSVEAGSELPPGLESFGLPPTSAPATEESGD